jgi:molecular chaperone DnaJ
MTTLYAVLGVDPRADTDTVRRAYRDLARRHHPDFGGDARQMASINDAWHVLSDPARRDGYDRQLQAPIRPPASPDGHTVMTFGRYEGWSLGDIATVDDDYLEWLSRMPIGRSFHREIGEILAQRSAAMEARRPRPIVPKRRWGLLSR